jgi:predicted nucleotidyltransferase
LSQANIWARWGIQAALDGNLCGVYLRGSLATGDFDPRTSDVDFFVVTKYQPGEVEFATVAAMHDRLAKLPNRYAQHLEGTYIDRDAVKQFHPGERYPTIFRQEKLIWYEHDYNWVLERWMIREKGITLLGPSPDTLIDPISSDDLRTAVRLRLPDWVDWANRPDDPNWQSPRSHKAYVIETMCRALCTLATGTLQSKPQAVAWALANLPDPWRATAERSLMWHADATIDPGINPEVRRFIYWTASQAR